MTRTLALALVGSALIGLPALAQTTTTPAANPPAVSAPATTTTAPRAGDANRPMYQMRQGQWRSSRLVGLNVYNNNDENIGDINELIVGQNGQVEAVVIGVGGFLGLGEHDVAVPYNQVRFMEEPRRAAARTAAGTDNRATVGTTPPVTTGNAPAATNPPAANTTGTVTAPQPAAPTANNPNQSATTGDGYRGYPDHAVVNMTKDQLQALPQVRYAR
jgi:sporulation protein YlmC with PRC-barrel domain